MSIRFSLQYGDEDIYVPDGDYSNVGQEYLDHNKAFMDTLPWINMGSIKEIRFSSSISFASKFNGHLTFPEKASLVGLANLETDYVKDMSSMFENYTAMKSIDLSSFKTPNVKDMSRAFANASTLEELDISKFDTRQNPSMDEMFVGCSALKKIKVGENFASKGQFPVGCWRDDSGNYFTEKEIPDYKAATYTYYGPVKPSLAQQKPAEFNFNVGKPSVKVSMKSITFTGSSQKPKFVVEIAGKRLVEGKDYSITYSNNNKVGIAKAVISGKGDYVGQITATFTINPKGVAVKTLKASKKGMTVKWKKPTSKLLKQITGYKIRYSTTKAMKKAKTKTVKASSSNGKKCSLKVSSLKSKKTYYVQVQTYKKVGKNTFASSWSKAKKVKVR